VCYIFPLLYVPPPLALAQAPPPPSYTPSVPQLPASPDSSRYDHGIPSNNTSWGFGDVHMVVDQLDTIALIEINLDDEEPNDLLKGDPNEEPQEMSLRRILWTTQGYGNQMQSSA